MQQSNKVFQLPVLHPHKFNYPLLQCTRIPTRIITHIITRILILMEVALDQFIHILTLTIQNIRPLPLLLLLFLSLLCSTLLILQTPQLLELLLLEHQQLPHFQAYLALMLQLGPQHCPMEPQFQLVLLQWTVLIEVKEIINNY